LYVEYTGTLDSACTVTIAPNTVNKVCFIENGTSGSQNIIIKQGSGATITIPPGDTKAVYLDGAGSGAKVVDAFASLSVVDLNVSGTALVTGVLTTTASAVFNGGFTSNGDTNTFTSANSTDPVLILKNTTNDTNGTRLHFIKDKGAAGADNDSIGTIQFTADNDAQQQILFGQILTRISDASDGAEGGQMQFSLASHDGEVQPFLNAVDGNAEDEIDVTIGSGTSSVTTIAGQVNAVGNVSVGVPTADTSLNFISVTGGLAGSQLNAQMRFFGKSISNTGVTYETARISGGSTSGSVSLSGGLVFSTSLNNGSNVLTLAEKMRITDTGKLLLNRTSQIHGGVFCMDYVGGTTAGIVVKDTTSSGVGVPMQVVNGDGDIVGAITQNQSATTFATSSDYRLKTDAQPITGASARVQALNPVNFEWIKAGTRTDGFLAHEAQAVVPEAVTGTKDAMMDEEYEVTPAVLDDDGNETKSAVMRTRSVPDMQGIDQSKIVPLLVAALQEALARITVLENA